jgi:hypothetical protein
MDELEIKNAIQNLTDLLSKAIADLAIKIDGFACHLTAVDADYIRTRNTLVNHEERLLRLENEHNFEPNNKIGESSALFPSIKAIKEVEEKSRVLREELEKLSSKKV